jgi:putative colanic acid biosynthesis UDP-glucose lipid carrier transferase
MNNKFKKQVQLLFIFSDLFCLYLSFEISRVLILNYDNRYLISSEFFDWKLSSLFWIYSSLFSGLYSKKITFNFNKLIKNTINTFYFFIKMLLIDNVILNNYFFVSTSFLLWQITFFILLLSFNRLIYNLIIRYVFSKYFTTNNVLILGYNDTAIKLAKYLNSELMGLHIIGFAEDKLNIQSISNYPIVSNLENALKVARDFNVRQIYSTISPSQNSFINKLIKQAEDACIRFRMVPDLSVLTNKPYNLNYLNELPVLSLHNDAIDDLGNIYLKRLLDIFISILVIVFILSWLIPLIGLLIKLESKGPIFFSQSRTGINNRLFDCLKFRSMKLNFDADKIQAVKNDSRVTKIGKFLRKSSIDEFPQFFNVLKGDMSIVGPRPFMVKHTDDYSKIVNNYMLRHFLKPGITGWAQINGLRGEINNQSQIIKRVSNDIWYLENWSIGLDFKIIFLTIWTLIFKRQVNAY